MNWKLARLADICEIKLGKTPSRSDKSYWDDKKVGSNIWVSIADLTKLNSRLIADSKEYITDKGASLFKPVKAGTLLMSFKLSIGKLAYTNCDLYTNEAIVALPIKDKNKINSDFLFYFLQFYDWDKETENDVKLKGKTLNKAKLNEIKVPIPPLATQQRIVAKLDAIFAEIDKASAAAEANAKNAEALWQSMIDKVITDFNHLNNKVSFSEVVEIKSKLVDPKEDKFQDFLHIGAGNMVSNNGELLDLKTAKEENLISGKFIFDENTVLYSKIRPYLKKVSQPSFVGLCSADVYPLVGIKNKITKDFLFFLLLSNDFTNYAIAGSDRAGMPKVNREHLFAYQFNLPAIELQNFLTTNIKNSYIYIKLINKAIKKKILELSLLKQSILKQAFNGELVKE